MPMRKWDGCGVCGICNNVPLTAMLAGCREGEGRIIRCWLPCGGIEPWPPSCMSVWPHGRWRSERCSLFVLRSMEQYGGVVHPGLEISTRQTRRCFRRFWIVVSYNKTGKHSALRWKTLWNFPCICRPGRVAHDQPNRQPCGMLADPAETDQ